MKLDDYIQKAAEHHTNLTMYHAIIALMESGSFYGDGKWAVKRKIITLCKAESLKELAKYDQARKKARSCQN